MRQSVPEFSRILTSLSNEKVRFVIVGGLAMVFHGASYVTFEFGCAIATDDPNIDAVIRALAPFRPFPPQLGSADSFVWDRRSFGGAVISLVTSAGDIDVLLVQPGVDSFEGLMSRSESRNILGMTVQVASIDDLITMKEAANRPKDVDHIRQLRAIKALREGKS